MLLPPTFFYQHLLQPAQRILIESNGRAHGHLQEEKEGLPEEEKPPVVEENFLPDEEEKADWSKDVINLIKETRK